MSDFKVLSDREHVLARSGVYIGSIVKEPLSGIIDFKYQTKDIVPAILKCIEEIYQNSIDEHIRTGFKFACNISVDFKSTLSGTEITVIDDGRGIPAEEINGSFRPVLAWTELRAGSNFDDNNRAGAGMNGMGAALVNIFSSSFIGETFDGKKGMEVRCSDNMSKIGHSKLSKSRLKHGTSVKFILDYDRFGVDDLSSDHQDVVYDRLMNLSVMYPTIEFKFNGKAIPRKSIKQFARSFHESAIAYEDDAVSMVFAPSGSDEEFRCHSYVNGIYVKNGGSHVDFVLWKISDTLRSLIKRKHKIEVLPNQIKQHLLFASWIRGFPSPRFDSQTKERIANSTAEVSSKLNHIDFEKIAKQIMGSPAILDPMIEAILHKKELADKRELAAKMKQTQRVRVVNHISATDSNPENRTLIITEGLSAIGTLISVRDPKKIGGYPLKGKIMNVRGMKPVDILKNKEIRELVSIVGLEFGKQPAGLNYGKIGIMVDSDQDGASIYCLLLNLFSNWPKLFDEGRIIRVQSPLYHCVKGKQSKVFYTTSEFEQFNSKGWDVSYFKGLGSMPKEVYKECMANMVYDVVTANDLADYDKLEMAFGDSSEPRKDWLINV